MRAQFARFDWFVKPRRVPNDSCTGKVIHYRRYAIRGNVLANRIVYRVVTLIICSDRKLAWLEGVILPGHLLPR